MKTPICDFVRQYAASEPLRLHMPGHKGQPLLGPEPLDLTEIPGADSLYEAEGVIAESEANASRLFGCATLYSTEGSSQCIRAMVHLALLHGRQNGKRPVIAAGRNVHKTFLSAAALLDAEVVWLYGLAGSYLSCRPDPAELELVLQQENPAAVYVTSPDYLGQMCDIAALAALCHRYDTLLLVDNAHGAYLRFLPESRHPMDLGADLCCSSAHKTLPVLTGGAYLHLSDAFSAWGKDALALFGSTSPSYLILQSLDLANQYLAGYRETLAVFLPKRNALRAELQACGYVFLEEEPLKLTVAAKARGYEGMAFAALLRQWGIECEFADRDYVVMMLTPALTDDDLGRLCSAMKAIPQKPAILERPPALPPAERVMSIRQAMLSPWETIPVGKSVGRVLAAATVGCPPAVPLVVSGERIGESVLESFLYYGIRSCAVVKE